MSLERLRRSFAGWPASRWLSSWPRHGFVFFPLRKLPAASMIICGCCVSVTGQILATRPSGRLWTGAMNSSPTGSVSCLPGCRPSRGASTWKPPRRCVPGVASFPTRSSTRSRAWWISRCWRWSAGQVPRASGCLISFASTPPSVWPRRARASRWRTGTVPISGNWPSAPTESFGRRARLDDESPNLRAAIDDGCARAPDEALAMVGALGTYWRVRGRLAEGVTATEQSLRAAPPEPSPGRALALAKLSLLSFWLGDFARTQSSATSALEMGAAIGDTRPQAVALSHLGGLVILGDPGAGDPMLLRAAELARTAGDQVALCDALASLAISYFFQDDPGAMRSPLEETLKVAEAIGFEDDIRWCLWCLAHTAFSAGELAGARAYGDRALAMMPGQDPLSRYCAVEVLCLLDANIGAVDAARERAEADLEHSRQERLRLGTGVLMHALGVAALAAGDLDRAEQWAASNYEQESEICYAAWHAQEILVAVALARDDRVQAKIHVERLLAAAEPLRNRRARAVGHLGLARALLLEGDDERAESVTHDALKVLMDNGWRPGVIDALDLVAEAALFTGRYERAIRLITAAQEERTTLGLVAFPTLRERTERNLASAGAALGDESLQRALQDGARLSLQEAVAYAQRDRKSVV